jgi:hypothetical protein
MKQTQANDIYEKINNAWWKSVYVADENLLSTIKNNYKNIKVNSVQNLWDIVISYPPVKEICIHCKIFKSNREDLSELLYQIRIAVEELLVARII